MKKVLLIFSVLLLSSTFCAAHRYHSSVNCSLFNIDPSASRSLGFLISTHDTSCRTRMRHGFPVPDPMCTPGAINPTITLQVLRNHHFRTSCLRNHVTSEHEKYQTYHWYSIRHPFHNYGRSQLCELDHLIPLELGGADTIDNIWPQCGPANVKLKMRYFKEKDMVENYLAMMVKMGSMSLSDAQKGITKDWTQYLSAARKTCPSGRCGHRKAWW